MLTACSVFASGKFLQPFHGGHTKITLTSNQLIYEN